MRGTLLAVGDLPEGGATAVRLRLMGEAAQAGGASLQIALLHATAKQRIDENVSSIGKVGLVPFKYLNDRTVRPTGAFAKLRDTARGVFRACRLVWRLRASENEFLILYTPILLRFMLPLLVARMRGIPVFVEACEVGSQFIGAANERALRRVAVKGGAILMEWLAAKYAMGLIVISEPILEFYRSKGVAEGRLFLLPILVDVEQYAQPVQDQVDRLAGKQYLLNSGSFTEKDGVPYLIRAFGKIADRYPKLHLVFTGHVPEAERKAAVRYIGDRAAVNRIIFTGFLQRQEMIWCYQNAVALLSCRSNSPYANFGLSTKLGEYLASGTPVIATRVGDTTRYLTHGTDALLAQPEDAMSIATCMEQVMDSPALARTLGERGQQLARRMFDYRNYSAPLMLFVSSRMKER